MQILPSSAHIWLNFFSAGIKSCSLDFSLSYETKQLHNLTRLLDGRRLNSSMFSQPKVGLCSFSFEKHIRRVEIAIKTSHFFSVYI